MKKSNVLLVSLIGGTALFLLLFGTGVIWFGSVGSLMANIRGESIYLAPRLLDLGSSKAGVETIAVFKMTNLTSKDISVVGERSSCHCAFSEQIPIVAPPGKTIDLKVNIHLPKYDSTYDQTILLMVAEPKRLAMYPVRIKANIPNPLPPPAEEESESAEDQTSQE